MTSSELREKLLHDQDPATALGGFMSALKCELPCTATAVRSTRTFPCLAFRWSLLLTLKTQYFHSDTPSKYCQT